MKETYIEFLLRPRPENAPRSVDMIPNFFPDTLMWSIIFIAGMLVVPHVASFLSPKWYEELDVKKKRELPSYVVSMSHHLRVVPIAWMYIYRDYAASSSDEVDFNYLLQVLAPFLVGFIIADTVCYAIPQLFHNSYEYFIHHVLALWLIYPFLYGPGSVARFYCHVVICETTNMFFNSAWLLRSMGYRDSAVVMALEILFAVAFLLIRVINLTLVFGIVFLSPEGRAFGISRYNLPPICMMQWYWMVRIVTVMFSKIGKLKNKSGSNGEGKTSKKVE